MEKTESPVTVKRSKQLTEDLERLSELLGTVNASEIVRQAVHKMRVDEERRVAIPCANASR